MIKLYYNKYNSVNVTKLYTMSRKSPLVIFKGIFQNGNMLIYLKNGNRHNPFGYAVVNNLDKKSNFGYAASKLFYYNDHFFTCKNKREYKRLIKLIAFK